MSDSFKREIFELSHNGFKALAMDIFYYQAKNNEVYSQFLQLIDVRSQNILDTSEIPFMPVELFKTHKVVSTKITDRTLFFTSSSTTGKDVSRHYIPDTELYHTSLAKSFEYQLGDIKDYTFRFLLPSYLERKNSSLVYMAEHLIRISGKGDFYLDNFKKLAADLDEDKRLNRKVLLLGVSFALMDFASIHPRDLSGILVMETGGMKGRRTEITREELHSFLKQKLNIDRVLSEYGMTELLSQAYSLKDGIFSCPPWMKIMIGQTTDPFAFERTGKTGIIKIMDLANIDSCCFIATSDLGRVYEDGSFEVLGRFDNSDVRGCNLLSPDISHE